MYLLKSVPQFRFLWANGGLNTLGGFMFAIVNGWLTLTVTDSPFWVGAAAGVGGVGMAAFAAVGGVLADRVSRRLLVGWATVVEGSLALFIAVMVFTGAIHLWHILVVSLCVGVMQALRVPAFFALTVDVVGRGRLLSANAANFVALGAGGILAPIIGGQSIDGAGMGWAFVIMGSISLAAAVFIFLMAEPADDTTAAQGEAGAAPGRNQRKESPFAALRNGAAYVFATPAVRGLIFVQLIGEAFGWSHTWMLPVIARDDIRVDAQGLGYLFAGGYFGYLVVTMVVSNLADIKRKWLMMTVGYAGFGIFLILFAFSNSFALSLALLAVAYGFEAAGEATLFTLIQTTVPDRMRGRVISFQAVTFGITGTAGFHTGALANRLGAPLSIAVGGSIVLANALRMAWKGVGRKRRHPQPSPE